MESGMKKMLVFSVAYLVCFGVDVVHAGKGKVKQAASTKSKPQKVVVARKEVLVTKRQVKPKELSAKEIIMAGETQMRGQSSQSTMHMFIKRPSYSRNLILRSWAKGSDQALVEILDPPKEEGVSSLRVGTQMWNYLPKTDQVVRVPTSLMLQSWMGSDFTNDDLMKASSLGRDYKHKIIRKEVMGKENLVVIQCTPLPNAPVVWGKIIHWARLKDNLPVKQEFFDDRQKLVRTINFANFKKMDDRVVPTVMRVVRADSKNEVTAVVYDKLFYNRDIPARVFDRDQIRIMSQRGKTMNAGWFFSPRHTGDPQ